MACAQPRAMTSPTFTRRNALSAFAATGTSLALAASPARLLAQTAPSDPAALLNRIAWQLIDLRPEGATGLGIDTGEHAALRSRLSDRSARGQAAVAALLKDSLAQVAAIDASGLDPATRTSLAVVRSAFSTALDGFALPYGDVAVGSWRNTPYAVIQNVGAWIDIPRFLGSEHPVHNAADAEAYLARLAQFPAQLDGETEQVSAARGIGLIPPDFLLDKTIVGIEQTLADAGRGGVLVDTLARKTTNIAGDWEARARAIVSGSVIPALERQLAELREQRARANSKAGMSARPHGEEWYAWSLRASTTTRRTPDELHAMGRAQLAELHGRMDPILRSLGYTKGTVGARMAGLGKDPRFAFSNDDKGRAEIVALMQAKIDFIRTRMPLAFRTLARGNLEIRRLPLAEEPGAPTAYGGGGSIDGSIPGRVWVNLSDPARHTRFNVPDLVFHEGIPGHVWQGEYARRLPLIRTLLAFNAYSEGWALYAQQLADELGAYDDDPVGRLGYLQGLAFRCCRLVVDTGIHVRGWSRKRALDWFVSNNGSSRAEVAPEIDRYCSWPGQACGYKVGHSEIVAQRDRAKTALGARYDLRDFDDAVVGGGNVPLDVLADNVSRYIADKS